MAIYLMGCDTETAAYGPDGCKKPAESTWVSVEHDWAEDVRGPKSVRT